MFIPFFDSGLSLRIFPSLSLSSAFLCLGKVNLNLIDCWNSGNYNCIAVAVFLFLSGISFIFVRLKT